MNPDAQRIAIAEFCGWRFKETNITPFGADRPTKQWHDPAGKKANFIPDYLNDLNAMHEAEKLLSDKEVLLSSSWFASQKDQYITYLEEIIEPTTCEDNIYFSTLSATAAQRAEALMKTINKWEDK